MPHIGLTWEIAWSLIASWHFRFLFKQEFNQSVLRLSCTVMRVLLYVSQRSIDGWYPDSNNKQAARCMEWKTEKDQNGSVLLKAAPSRSTQRPGFMATQIYTTALAGYLMWWRSASPQAKSSFSPDLQWYAPVEVAQMCDALMECQRKGQTMQILFVQPNQKRHKGNYPFAETCLRLLVIFFASRLQALNVTDKDLQHDFS